MVTATFEGFKEFRVQGNDDKLGGNLGKPLNKGLEAHRTAFSTSRLIISPKLYRFDLESKVTSEATLSLIGRCLLLKSRLCLA